MLQRCMQPMLLSGSVFRCRYMHGIVLLMYQVLSCGLCRFLMNHQLYLHTYDIHGNTCMHAACISIRSISLDKLTRVSTSMSQPNHACVAFSSEFIHMMFHCHINTYMHHDYIIKTHPQTQRPY
ncbi:hypothetical protein Hanom_Chr12g01107211 [Helianthus anomalus]